MINFQQIKQKYQENPLAILEHLVGKGEVIGGDYVALNPRRKDSKLGSFRIDIVSGKFHDFATGDSGGSIIDLITFTHGCDLKTVEEKSRPLFLSLASTSIATEKIPAKKKKLDIAYIWKKSIKTQHQYLNNKKVSIGNARVNIYRDRRQLVIPLTDSCPTIAENLSIKGLQFIDEDGNKGFPLPFKGLSHVASDYKASKEVIIITEGYATARSIAQSTDFYVVAAMSAYNLKSVAIKISEQFRYSRIVIAADNDEAGIKAAKEAKQSISDCSIVYPKYECNDFNDLFIAYGEEAVKACLEVFHV